MDFTSFLRDKQYLENVSPNTLRWYRHALKWLPTDSPDEVALKDMVIRMREAGLKETGCNAAIRAINCYLRWTGSPQTVRLLKEPALILPTFTTDQVKRLMGYKPKTVFQQRLHLLIMVLLDTGCRISEALELRGADVDLDNLLITLHGKGRKDRKVPMSFERYSNTDGAKVCCSSRPTVHHGGVLAPYDQSNFTAASSVLNHRSELFTPCGTHSRLTICAKAARCFTCKRCSGTARLK